MQSRSRTFSERNPLCCARTSYITRIVRFSAWWRRGRAERAENEPGPPQRDEIVNTIDGPVAGGVVQAGTIAGDVNLVTGMPVRTQYRQQVRRIAPPELVGREPELAELAEFCTSPDAVGCYRWWRAPAWSGKTALLSWFVLHPPVGVRVVSFFVTARLASQNDRTAFIDNTLEQLLALLGEDMPPFLTDATREAHLLGSLTEAAEVCHDRGDRLVLVVDGLDKDRGVTVGPAAHSIASLLPAQPPAGMRIIVAGRPNPPLPADVPDHHPLRDPAIVRRLEPSARAQAVRLDMERELKTLLGGTPAEQDLLGLVTASGGGLTAPDLAALTGWTVWDVEDQLSTVTGRSFNRRGSRYRPGIAPDVYLLGHEDLQVTARTILGPARLDGYRQRLHTWAEHYRDQRWPGDTPEYPLRGYYNMLTATGGLPRMIACATDPARQDRMLDLSGGDAVALAEITTALDLIAAQDDADLIAMVRLAIHRDHLRNRNSNIPTRLPAVWALLGEPNRAESLAHSIPDHRHRAWALAAIAEVVLQADDGARGAALIAEAEALARRIADPQNQGHALMRVAEATANGGDLDRAETIARSIPEDYWHELALSLVAKAAAMTGDLDRATTLADAITDAYSRLEALARVAEVAAKLGELDRAGQLITQAENTANSLANLYQRSQALARVAGAAAATGDLDRATTAADAITDPDLQAETWARIAETAAQAGDVDRAAQLITRAERTGRTVIDQDTTDTDLTSLARTTACSGDIDRAEVIANSVTDLDMRAQALTSVAEATANAGDLDRAEAIANSIADPQHKASALTALTTDQVPPERRERVIAEVLRLGQWHLPLRGLVRMLPDAVPVILTELHTATSRF